jgi:hypothetical protein
LTKDFAVTESDAEEVARANIQRARVGQRAAIDRVEPPPAYTLVSRPRTPLLVIAPVVDSAAPFSRSNVAPTPIEASVRALFEPSAALSS